MMLCNHPECERLRKEILTSLLNDLTWEEVEENLVRVFVDVLFDQVKNRQPLTRAFITETFHTVTKVRDDAIEIMAERYRNAPTETVPLRGEPSPSAPPR